MTGSGWRPLLAGLLIALATIACALTGAGDDDARSAEDVRATLRAQHDALRAGQIAAVSLWDRLIIGEPVSCQEAIPVPGPLDLPLNELDQVGQGAQIQGWLNTAQADLRQSANLWDIECADPRALAPLAIAGAGYDAARAAASPLEQAAAALGPVP